MCNRTGITDRLYGLLRNPQHTGLFIAILGEGIVHWPTIFSDSLFPVIVFVFYLPTRSVERKVQGQVGDEYRDYRIRVPMFIPHRGQWGGVTTTRVDTSA